MRSRALTALAFVILTAPIAACDFFKELESEPGAEESESGSEEEGGIGTPTDFGTDEPCTTLDDSCPGQDSLLTCDPTIREVLAYDCGLLCADAGQLNVSCTVLSEGSGLAHGCWCAVPNQFKLDSCSQVDDCVFECGGLPDVDGPCTEECFARTDASTVRLLGALYHCADQTCDALCAASPFECMQCVFAARAGLYGDCAVERSICDADETDEPSWP